MLIDLDGILFFHIRDYTKRYFLNDLSELARTCIRLLDDREVVYLFIYI